VTRGRAARVRPLGGVSFRSPALQGPPSSAGRLCSAWPAVPTRRPWLSLRGPHPQARDALVPLPRSGPPLCPGVQDPLRDPRFSILAPSQGPLLHTRGPGSSRVPFPLALCALPGSPLLVPVPVGVPSARPSFPSLTGSSLRTTPPVPEFPSPRSPRPGSCCHHPTPGRPHLRPAVTTPGPGVAAVAASSLALVPESLSSGLSLGGPPGRVPPGAEPGCAQPPPQVPALRPTLQSGPRRPVPHRPSRGRRRRRRCCCPRCGSCQGWPIAPDCAERAPPPLLSPPAPCPRPRPQLGANRLSTDLP
jgi:hypothetical protein